MAKIHRIDPAHDPRDDRIDTSARHLNDSRLRHHGFRIHSRPKRGPVTWEIEGRVVTQEEAHRLCDEWEKPEEAANG